MTRRSLALTFAVAAALTAAACERETRKYQEVSVTSTRAEGVPLSSLKPGGGPPDEHKLSPYTKNAFGQSEGKRLFAAFNCSGCHANGGGGIGPALMDDKWIYGGEIQQIAATILQGRPNGMPSFRGRVPDEQVWQIAAYVRSMGRGVRQDAAPARDDDMQVKPAENRMPFVEPGSGALPEGARRPQ